MQQDDSIQTNEDTLKSSPDSQSNSPVNAPEDQQADDESQILVGGAEDPKKEGTRNIISTILILVAAPLVALILISFVFQSYEVDGPSMETTLQNHDRLIVDKMPRTISRLSGRVYIPNRGDVVIFVKKGLVDFGSGGDKQLIKRVIALPGERVVVKDGVLTVFNKANPNGFQPDKNPSYTAAIKTTAGEVDVTVAENEVFVCGDNRENSLDSRYFGAIPAGDIVGKLSFRIFPINKAEKF